MSTPVVKALMLDMVEWLARRPRPYAEAIEAWRTSCPRLTVWEDAMEEGVIESRRAPDGGLYVAPTQRGLDLLRARHHRPEWE
ncbi:hypothetical protein EJV46_02325 [Roseococcus sp. SYP-B2431]|uniref:hypothetical protein n=1 Tax=Roseococcus sp. SYP-B2431 TaxID=2496640 RepID=UPI00103FF661|nr:hypothetical protein [Roseococcus sp. SYP-B2431]TCH99532.1 hypothetical protein EJV46_02325 [Roseococcus sp. SYP-B2431]